MQFGVKLRDLAPNLPHGGGLQEYSFRQDTVNGSRTRVVEALWTRLGAVATWGAAPALEGRPFAWSAGSRCSPPGLPCRWSLETRSKATQGVQRVPVPTEMYRFLAEVLSASRNRQDRKSASPWC